MKHLKEFENNYTIKYSFYDLADAISRLDLYEVKNIINSGFDINKKVEKNENILNYIVTRVYNYEIVEELIKSGVDFDNVADCGDTALIFVAYYPTDIRFVEILIEAGADWNIKDSDGEDFFDYLTTGDKAVIAKKYPEKYEDYMVKKYAEEKYNL